MVQWNDLHRTLFDQLRAVRLQWALSLGVQPERLPTTYHYHGCYNTVCSSSTSTWSRTQVLLLIRTTTTSLTTILFVSLARQSLQTLATWSTTNYDKGISSKRSRAFGLAKDPTTDEHLIALPPIYDNHPSVTGSIYKCRGITRLPRPNMWDTTFLATIQWPPMESMDYIEPDVSENYKYLQEHKHKHSRTTCTTTTSVPTSYTATTTTT